MPTSMPSRREAHRHNLTRAAWLPRRRHGRGMVRQYRRAPRCSRTCGSRAAIACRRVTPISCPFRLCESPHAFLGRRHLVRALDLLRRRAAHGAGDAHALGLSVREISDESRFPSRLSGGLRLGRRAASALAEEASRRRGRREAPARRAPRRRRAARVPARWRARPAHHTRVPRPTRWYCGRSTRQASRWRSMMPRALRELLMRAGRHPRIRTSRSESVHSRRAIWPLQY